MKYAIKLGKILIKLGKFSLIMLLILTIIWAITLFLGDSIEVTPALVSLNNFTAQMVNWILDPVKKIIPYKISGYDFSLLILVLFITILYTLLARISLRLSMMERQYAVKLVKIKNKDKSPLINKNLSDLDKKLTALENAKPRNRKEMLKEFVSLKNQLDRMGQECAFLSIDVVNSTGMKFKEDKLVAAHDFDRYNEIARETLTENGVIKYTTTPDGIMSCFRTVDDAVNAGVTLLERLSKFNATEKQIKSEFQIRCGINSGFVYIEGLPLEQVTDHVIDVAGHMQKHAKPNTINIAGNAIEPLKSRAGFAETTDVIDKQRVYVWGLDK